MHSNMKVIVGSIKPQGQWSQHLDLLLTCSVLKCPPEKKSSTA